MKRSVSRFVHASSLIVCATGAAWAWMAYVWDPGPEPLDPEELFDWSGRHDAEPLVRNLHLIGAPLLVFAVGLIWISHVAPRLRSKWARRRTGLTLAILFGPMVLSGVLLQTASTEEGRTLWAWVHGVSAAVWTLGYLLHMLGGRWRSALGYLRTKN